MPDQTPNYNSADALRKAQKYEEALLQFEALWEQQPSVYIGWRYVYCLRKTGQMEKAEQTARVALEKYPTDKFTKKELGWILYDRELKPAREDGDLGRLVHVANEIVKLNDEPFAVRLVVLAVMKIAKAKGRWEVVLDWANKIKAQDLGTEVPEFDGKRGMSERETWYVGKARALLELNRWDEARTFAQQGLAEFPDELFLARTAAFALAGSGDVQKGALEMRQLLNHRRAGWYVRADVAELECRSGNYPEAYRLMCEAISNSQDDEFKLGYFVTLAQIGLALNKLEIAAEHVALAKAVRTQNNWSLSTELVEIENAVQSALNSNGQTWPDLPTDVAQLSKLCHRRWREGATEGMELFKGALKGLDPAKPFAFIKRDDGGEDVFVIVRDIPRRCAQEGSRLEFALKKSFDKKKNRESVQATNIRCA